MNTPCYAEISSIQLPEHLTPLHSELPQDRIPFAEAGAEGILIATRTVRPVAANDGG